MYDKESGELKYESMVCRSRNTKIKNMEEKITHLATETCDFKEYKTMMDYKERKISSLKKKLKIADAHLVHTNKLEKAKKENHELKKNIHGMRIKNKE